MKYDYTLLDSGNYKKLEQVGPYRMIRPCLQALWSPSHKKEWQKRDFEFERSKEGKSEWKRFKKNLPSTWKINLSDHQKSLIKLTDFGHLGFFPEHHTHYTALEKIVSKNPNKKLKVLNLFAYTGALSLFLARLGAEVTHLDASKKSIEWGKENLGLSKFDQKSIRWIADDVMKFVLREKRRGTHYDGVILDPPTFGRGTKGELWKIEEHLPILLKELMSVLKKDYSFIILSSHTPGHTPLVLKNLLSEATKEKTENLEAFELTVTEKFSQRELPSGACSMYVRK